MRTVSSVCFHYFLENVLLLVLDFMHCPYITYIEVR